MGTATSKDMALSVLVPLPFVVVSTVLRFWIRASRKAWGPDDWAMLVNVPFWLVAVIGMIGMAWSGVGALDSTLTEQQYSNSLMWFYVFQEPWCFTLITIKWSIGFTLIRIANGKRWIEIVIYTCMVCLLLVMGGTGMYLFFQCTPVEKNWHPTMVEGSCQPRNIQTALSFLVAAVSITTDWIFATLPVFLLWNVQMQTRIKLSVVGMLSLGVFASIAPIVRLKYLLGMNDQTRFLQNLGIILAWASAEMNVGMLIANLPACRPLLERVAVKFSSLTGSGTRAVKPGNRFRTGSASTPGINNYLELDEREAKNMKVHSGLKSSGNETRIYGKELRGSDDSIATLTMDDRDDGSQKRIVRPARSGTMQVHVRTEFEVEVNRGNEKKRNGPGDMV